MGIESFSDSSIPAPINHCLKDSRKRGCPEKQKSVPAV